MLIAESTTDWSLIGCHDGTGRLHNINVNAQPFVIGRSSNCDLTIKSRRVSGSHAELMQVGDHLLLRDLNSTNGTFLQGRRIVNVTPVGDGDLLQFADCEFRLRWSGHCDEPEIFSTSANERTAFDLDTFEPDWVFTNFEKLLDKPGIIPAYQPVIRLEDSETVGYEALARSNTLGLETPGAMFSTAEMLSRATELSKECRHRGVYVSQFVDDSVPVYLNTHPSEDLLKDVLPDMQRLRENYPGTGIVLEIHEAAFTNVNEMRRFAACLEDLAIDLAYDDFGAGRSRLVELLEVPPAVLKCDASLIRSLKNPNDRVGIMLGSMVRMMRDVGIRTLAEGVETEDQAACCRQLGFELAQGYLFGRPAPAANFVDFDSTVTVPMSTHEMNAVGVGKRC